MDMRGNRVKEKLAAGEIATVLGGHSNNSETIDFIGSLGFDGFWLEGEHGSVTWDQIGDLSRACDLWDMASIMRVRSNDPALITRTLDRGVNGIVVPHINTKEEAERVVQAAKFAPIGQRGIFSSRRSYDQQHFFQQANDETLVVVLLEEIQAIENLSNILTVDNIDVFFVAPGDLAQTMGLIGQMDHPEVLSLVETAIQQIVAADRVAGVLTISDDETLERYVGLGARFLLTVYDNWIKDGAQQYLSRVATLS